MTTSMSHETPKPCPFDCGGAVDPYVTTHGAIEMVQHLAVKHCIAEGDHRLADWNRRAAPVAPERAGAPEAWLVEGKNLQNGYVVLKHYPGNADLLAAFRDDACTTTPLYRSLASGAAPATALDHSDFTCELGFDEPARAVPRLRWLIAECEVLAKDELTRHAHPDVPSLERETAEKEAARYRANGKAMQEVLDRFRVALGDSAGAGT